MITSDNPIHFQCYNAHHMNAVANNWKMLTVKTPLTYIVSKIDKKNNDIIRIVLYVRLCALHKLSFTLNWHKVNIDVST